MNTKSRFYRKSAIAVALMLSAGLVSLLVTTTSGASSGRHPSSTKVYPYYLSLGDSLSVGYQPTGGSSCPVSVTLTAPAGCTTQGYSNDLYSIYKKTIKGLKFEELGCPGESTATMISGGICTYSDGNQLAQAESFIENNDVAFITIDIGANDVDGCAGYVTSNPPDPTYATDVPNCVENGATDATYGVSADGIAGINTNLPTILSGLENAENSSSHSKGAAIYGMNYYDPFLALYLESTFTGPSGFAETSTSLAGTLNSALASDYAGASGPGPVSVADVQGIFKTSDSSPPATYTPPANPIFTTLNTDPTNVQAICAWTWECTTYENIHANKTGYEEIAAAFVGVMGYLP